MNIAFDAKMAYISNTGLGSHARTHIKSLNAYYPENQYSLFTTRITEGDFKQYIAAQTNIKVYQPESSEDKNTKARWYPHGITDILTKNKYDIYHGLSNELPHNIKSFKGKKIVTIHDLIFLRQPDLYSEGQIRIYNKRFRHACDLADTIIAISEDTKADIEKYYFIPSDKIKVVYQSCNELFYQPLSQEYITLIKEQYKLPGEFLLYVGTIEERKNLLTIVKALKNVNGLPLVVAGRKTSYYKTVKKYIEENNLKNRVIFLNSVNPSHLPAMYHLAKIYVFPSLQEGFGIPIIEALTSKTPVITTQGGCFPETGGPDTIYIDPTDDNELAEKINFLLGSETACKLMAEKGFEYAKRFYPEKITKELMDVYNS